MPRFVRRILFKLCGLIIPRPSRGCVIKCISDGPEFVERPEPPVKDLPKLRRELTSSRDEVNPQEQSLLVNRLPVELRLIIWEFAMGSEHDDDVLHLQPVDGILRHCRCFEPDRTILGFRHYCWTVLWTAEHQAFGVKMNHEPDDTRKIRSLLLTCKLMYARTSRTLADVATLTQLISFDRYQESVNILYETNTFDMRQIESILRLPRVMPSQRLQHIRSIQFSTAFQTPMRPDVAQRLSGVVPDDHSKWLAACQILATLKSLETLKITIAIWSRTPWSLTSTRREPSDAESLLTVLEPLKLVSASCFTVVLTESVPEAVREMLGSLPYTISQRVRPGIGYFSSDDL